MRLNITQKKRRKKMENKINIAEILRDCPKGTKLYSLLFGKCEFREILSNSGYPIRTYLESEESYRSFTEDGRYLYKKEYGECILFPSAKMRCWSKFFKRGDVVVNQHAGLVAIFEGWVDDEYTEFNTTINLIKKGDFWGEEEVCPTECFAKVTDEERAEFIAAAETHYGGKYNPETLRVEPVEPKCPFKPFQKVLVRDDDYDGVWKAGYFSHYDEGDKSAPYICVGSLYKFCILYEGNEHLLGTNKSPE